MTMAAKFMLMVCVAAQLSWLAEGGGHGGGHKKVIIHVPYKVHHHHHKHTIVKHIHHKAHGGGGGDDHYEVLGYTYGEPKKAAFGGGHGWHVADEGQEGHDTPASFDGNSAGYGLSAAGDEHGYGYAPSGSDYSADAGEHGGY